MTSSTALHLIIPTHTTRHLDTCLVGIARQSIPPTTITVTCDVDDDSIESLLRTWSARLDMTIHYVRREKGETERLAQVRNNAVRNLLDMGFDSGRLLFLDGDTFASTDCVEKHVALGLDADMVLPWRINLTEKATARLDPEAILEGRMSPPQATQAHLAEMKRWHHRAMLHQALRFCGLTKRHKPRLLGGHHSVRLERFIDVNGHDEEYHTWGTEDDDFARRIYAIGGTSVIAARDILVFHLYHPTRAPSNWHDRPNARRFKRRDLPAVAEHGLRNPMPQADVRVDRIERVPTGVPAYV